MDWILVFFLVIPRCPAKPRILVCLFKLHLTRARCNEALDGNLPTLFVLKLPNSGNHLVRRRENVPNFPEFPFGGNPPRPECIRLWNNWISACLDPNSGVWCVLFLSLVCLHCLIVVNNKIKQDPGNRTNERPSRPLTDLIRMYKFNCRFPIRFLHDSSLGLADCMQNIRNGKMYFLKHFLFLNHRKSQGTFLFNQKRWFNLMAIFLFLFPKTIFPDVWICFDWFVPGRWSGFKRSLRYP